MALFLTADHHFGHARIIEYCNRPFTSVEQMNDAMVEAWNSRVGVDDCVLHLGDVAFLKRMDEHTVSSLKKLNGKKVLIRGNHDRECQLYRQLGWCVVDGSYKSRVKLVVGDITFIHNPCHTVPESGTVIHGHCHGTRGVAYKVGNVEYRDVGVDTSNFEPIHVGDVLHGKQEEDVFNIVSAMFEKYHVNNMVRASGDCVCKICGKEYRKHPMDMEQLSGIDGTPFLHGCVMEEERSCDTFVVTCVSNLFGRDSRLEKRKHMYNVTTTTWDKYGIEITTNNGPFSQLTAERFAIEAMHSGKHYNVKIVGADEQRPYNESVGVNLQVSTMNAEDVEKTFIELSTVEKRSEAEDETIIQFLLQDTTSFAEALARVQGYVTQNGNINKVVQQLVNATTLFYDVTDFDIHHTIMTVCQMKFKHATITLLDKKQVRSLIDGFMHVALAAWNDKKKS